MEIRRILCLLNKAYLTKKRSKLSKDQKKVLTLHKDKYNQFFKHIACFFKET